MGLGDIVARGARIAAISAQIAILREKISKARSVKTELKNSDTALNNTLMQWTSRYNAFQSSPMSEIVVPDKFEGVSAEKIRTRLPVAIEQMTATQSSTESVQSEISEQITKLDTYIAELEEKIAALRSEMAAI